MNIIDRKLPRKGICPAVFSDSCLRSFNIAEIPTDLVISEKDLSNRLRDANTRYVFPVMENWKRVMEVFSKY